MYKLTKIKREAIANTLRLGAKFKSVDNNDYPNGLLMYWPSTSLEDVLSNNGLAPIIDVFELMFKAYKINIEEYLYQYKNNSADYFYNEDYINTVINLCNMLGVDVTPKHHKIKNTYVGLYPIELFKDFIKLIINNSELPLCFVDSIEEGGCIFVDQFEHLSINWGAYDINDYDADVDYNKLKNMIYYAGCMCSVTGIIE